MPGGELLRVTATVAIPLEELEWRFSGSGGPGGQHANTAKTRAEVRFDVAGSPTLGPSQRARLMARLGPAVRVVASDERSQLRNRELALERLARRVGEGLHVDHPPRPTRRTAAPKRRRLEDKRRKAQRKRELRSEADPDG